jgi:nucleoside diphosphate kinase
MVKPDGIPLQGTIREMIDPVVDIIASRSFDPVDIGKIEQLYEMHKNEFFFPYLIAYFRDKPVTTYVVGEKENVDYHSRLYEDVIELVGDTDPARAKPGTIRSLSSDSLERSVSEKRALRNLVHRSTTPEETEREASIFFWDYIWDQSKVAGEQGGLGRFLAKEGDGIFFEERLESSLRRHNLLSSDEALIRYEDPVRNRGGSSHEERALIKTLKNGVSSTREVTLTIER